MSDKELFDLSPDVQLVEGFRLATWYTGELLRVLYGDDITRKRLACIDRLSNAAPHQLAWPLAFQRGFDAGLYEALGGYYPSVAREDDNVL